MTQLNSRFAKGLYGITPEWEDKNRLLTAIEEACRGGMQILQWRQKNLSLSNALPLALKTKAICHQYACQFFVNDSVQLALACQADGIHIGAGVELINRNEFRPETEADDRYVDFSFCAHRGPTLPDPRPKINRPQHPFLRHY